MPLLNQNLPVFRYVIGAVTIDDRTTFFITCKGFLGILLHTFHEWFDTPIDKQSLTGMGWIQIVVGMIL